MFTIVYMIAGLISFAGGAGLLGAWLRQNPSRANAERSSRVVHFLFFAGLVAPGFIAVFYPGLTHIDERVGLRPLPAKRLFRMAGLLLALPGFYLLGASNRLLRALGSGANAFRLTKQVVRQDVYRLTRNPMSLGSYLLWLSAGFLAGSSFLTLVAALGMIPVHLFALKYFEERELELRFGDAYRAYQREVPFLIPRLGARDAAED